MTSSFHDVTLANGDGAYVFLQNASLFEKTVLYFQGDIQQLRERQSQTELGLAHIEYCLEETLAVLASKFPSANIVSIKPSGMENDRVVFPQRPTRHLLHQYLSLARRALLVASGLQDNEDGEVSQFPNASVTVIGFSRGCHLVNGIVAEVNAILSRQAREAFATPLALGQEELIQSIYEDARTKTLGSFVKVSALVWLDSDTFPYCGKSFATGLCAEVAKGTLTGGAEPFAIPRLYLFSTPATRQSDPRKAWIKEDFEKFTGEISEGGVDAVLSHICTEGAVGSVLATHFRVIKDFSL